MDDDSQESPQASSYCMIDTPEKEKPLTREEDLPSAEEEEEKVEQNDDQNDDQERRQKRK